MKRKRAYLYSDEGERQDDNEDGSVPTCTVMKEKDQTTMKMEDVRSEPYSLILLRNGSEILTKKLNQSRGWTV